MTLSKRDRRALTLAGGCAALFLVIGFWPEERAVQTVEAVESIPQAEQRLQRLRQRAAAVPARDEALGRVRQELARREKGLIQAETVQQAQAQMLQAARRIWSSQQPPLEVRNIEFQPPRPFGDFYGETAITASVEGTIEQMVNLLADLTSQPELISVSDITFGQASPKDKKIQVRLTVSALVPKKLIPSKKPAQGGMAF